MVYVDAFKHFEPIAGQLPDALEFVFKDILVRARSFLEGIPRTDIEAAAENLGWFSQLLDLPYIGDELVERLGVEPLSVFAEDTYWLELLYYRLTPVARVMTALRKPLEERSHDVIKRVTWEQHFAVLALVQVASAVEEFETMAKEGLGEPYPSAHWTQVAAEAVEAAESVAIAELLQREGELRGQIDRVGEENRKKARKAALIRHAKNRRVKEAFVAFKDEYPDLSGREAARRYYQGLSEDEQRVMCPTLKVENAVRTLTDLLAQRRRV